MFERYTEQARRVIFYARYEASLSGSPSIDAEHLLLGMLREDTSLVSRYLPAGGGAAEALREAVYERLHKREKIGTSVELPLSAEAKRVLAYAHEESERLGDRHVGPEHLILGLLREEGTLAAQLLDEKGVRLEALREELSGTQREEPRQTQTTTPITGRVPQEPRWSEELRHYGGRLLALAEELLGGAQGRAKNSAGDGGGADAEGVYTEALRPEKTRAVRSGRRTILGIEKLLESRTDLLRGARVGLVCNQASVDHEYRHVADLLRAHAGVNLKALFGPQHGIRGDVQDNMVETPHATDSETGLPIHSLYSETREPTERMLEDVDVLVFDMQDVGCRIYTFVYTLANCMRAAKKYGKRVVVCDRPNPINGVQLAGTLLEPEYASFVGQFPILTRHGMTVCELARMFNERFGVGAELEVVPMEGWARELWFDETDAPWVLPSPNMPTLDSATVFPGTVHLEGTQMSEGRGTTRPFELVGAPYIEAPEYARRLEALGLEGVRFRAANFLPTFQKHAGEVCGGVQIHVTDRESFEPVSAGVATVKLARDLYGDFFRWKEPPYEYVYDKNPFDVIAGTARLRGMIEGGESLEDIRAGWAQGEAEFARERERYLLY